MLVNSNDYGSQPMKASKEIIFKKNLHYIKTRKGFQYRKKYFVNTTGRTANLIVIWQKVNESLQTAARWQKKLQKKLTCQGSYVQTY